jgi:hypothetical protein
MVSSPPCACVRVLADVDHNDGSLLQPPEDVDLLRAATTVPALAQICVTCGKMEEGF